MSELLEIFTFALFVVNSIFDGLDLVYFGSYSILDILITLFIFDRILWFVFKLLGHTPESIDTIDSSDPMEDSINAVDENYKLSKDRTTYSPSMAGVPKGFSWKYQGPGGRS